MNPKELFKKMIYDTRLKRVKVSQNEFMYVDSGHLVIFGVSLWPWPKIKFAELFMCRQAILWTTIMPSLMVLDIIVFWENRGGVTCLCLFVRPAGRPSVQPSVKTQTWNFSQRLSKLQSPNLALCHKALLKTVGLLTLTHGHGHRVKVKKGTLTFLSETIRAKSQNMAQWYLVARRLKI